MSPADQAYVRASYHPLAALCADADAAQRRIAAGTLPGPAYVLPDGSRWFPADLFAFPDEAGEELADLFRARFVAAAVAEGADPDQADDELASYLSGVYGVCLHRVSPETIVAKEVRVARITARMAAPMPDDAGWLAALREDVDALDRLIRPFAACDRERFGGSVSRDRCVDLPRRRWLSG
jgi:hypothetical protein